MIDELNNDEIIGLIKDDDLNRNKYLFRFLKLINKSGNNHVFSLNGKWGSGKTVFIKKINCLINYCYLYSNENSIRWDNIFSKYNSFSNDNLKNLKTIINSEEYKNFDSIIKENNIFSIYINLWEHDDELDPIISIVYELIKQFNLEKYNKQIKVDIKKLVNLLFKLKTNGMFDINNFSEDFDIYKQCELKDEIKHIIKKIIDDIICENCNKLVIFIDELDRCNPLFTIKTLERIKHYFNDNRLIIVLSTNIKELSNTISSVYGENFSSEEYLDKIIDLRLELPKVNYNDYIKTTDSIINYEPNSWLSIVEEAFINYKDLQLRNIKRYFGCMNFFESGLTPKDKFMIDNIECLINCLYIPYLVGLFCININDYNSFLKGKGWNNFKEFINNFDEIKMLCFSCIYNNSNEITEKEMFEELQKMYNKMFEKSDNKFSTIKIGDHELYINSLKSIEQKVSILGDLSTFS